MGDNTLAESDENIEKSIKALLEKIESMRVAARSEAHAGRTPARLELRTLGLWKAVLAECVASFLYVFIVCGAAGGAGVGASTSATVLATAIASGCAITTLTRAFDNISGAHINPAVSVALCVRRRVTPLRAALYVCAHCGGAIAGAALLYGITVPGYQGNLAASMSSWGGVAWARLVAELLLSMVVVVSHNTSPLQLGAAYCACTFVSMPYLNPARSLGPAFVLGKWEHQWAYWTGPIVGAVIVALLLHRTERDDDTERGSEAGYVPAPPRSSGYVPAAYVHAYKANAEPLYGGTKSLYGRSPPVKRHTLQRSQSVHGKAALLHQTAQSAQNTHNAGLAARRDSLYGRRACVTDEYAAYHPSMPACAHPLY